MPAKQVAKWASKQHLFICYLLIYLLTYLFVYLFAYLFLYVWNKKRHKCGVFYQQLCL